MRIFWDNLIDAATITPLTEHANYPATNLRDQRLSRVWRSLILIDQTIVIDFGEAKEVTSLTIANHNFTASVTAVLEGNASDSWGTPAVTETLIYDAGIISKIFTGGSYRYWRLKLNDTTNADGYLEIGRMFLGTYLQMPPIAHTPTIPYLTTSTRTRSASGQTYGDRGYRYYAPSFSFPFITDDERIEIEEMFETVESIKPVFLMIWEDSLDVFPVLYTTITNDAIEWTRGDDFSWAATLSFEEEK